MKATLESMDLEYNAFFTTPLFDLPARSIEVLRALHEAISPVSAPSSSDMQVIGGSRLSDVRIGLNLFNGEGWLNLTTDSLAMRFNRLQRSGDLTRCKTCIALTERTLKTTLPALAVHNVNIRPTLRLRLDAPEGDAARHLAQVSGNYPQVDLSGLGDATVHPAIALDIDNNHEGWDAIFDSNRLKHDKTAINATCRVSHFHGGTIQDLDNRISHLQHVLRALLNAIGLDVSGVLWETPPAEPSP